jgi:hypothetical protein
LFYFLFLRGPLHSPCLTPPPLLHVPIPFVIFSFLPSFLQRSMRSRGGNWPISQNSDYSVRFDSRSMSRQS